MIQALGSEEEEAAPKLDPVLRRGGWRIAGRSLRDTKRWIVLGIFVSLTWAVLKLW
ncbi:MAG: hypothetical protein QOI61_430, partial [Actinomycetota bacterium]